ncbi:MAG: ROK family protein [Clostridia bacterium]|nr:ROK family protein [Clostridia bacterium]
MYIVSAAMEKGEARAALYDGAYTLLVKKEGKDLAKLSKELLAEGGVDASAVAYVGAATDNAEGSPECFAAELEKKIGIKCYGTSLMSAKALGEAYLANDVGGLVLLEIDDFVKSGIVIDKKVYAGVAQLGGKLGHLTVQHGGYPCACGRTGCFEAYAANSGVKRIAKDAGVKEADSLTVTELFTLNTPEAEKAKKVYTDYLACAITNVINLFQPNELVLDGPFTQVGDALMKPMMEFVLREQYTRSSPDKCAVRFPNKEEDTALLGAALLGR